MSSRGVNITPQRHPRVATASGRAPSTTLEQQLDPSSQQTPTESWHCQLASRLLTHRRAEVELLQACEEMILMKAFEASENFLMSTGLGTLPVKGGVSAV